MGEPMAVQVGDSVVRKPVTFSRYDEDQKKHTQAAMRGKVVYVHPQGRFHTVEFMTGGGAIRESFQGVER